MFAIGEAADDGRSPPCGEMSGRTEGGDVERLVSSYPNLQIGYNASHHPFALTAAWAAASRAIGTRKGEQET